MIKEALLLNIKKNATKWLMITLILCALSIETVSAAKLHFTQKETENSEPLMVDTVNIEQLDFPLAQSKLFNIVEDAKVIASNPSLNITIRGKENSDGTYENMSIHAPTFNCKLAGVQVTNPEYAPEIYSSDLDGDGQPEIVVILTNGYGTGVYQTEVHVYRQDGTLINVEDAQQAWNQQLHTQINVQQIDLQVNGTHMILPTSILQDQEITSDTSVEVGAVRQYQLDQGKLIVKASVQVGMMDILGELTTVYQYNQGRLEAQSSTLVVDEPYQSAIQTK